ncbi:MAG: hypothetical protein ABIK62_04790, partial [candidate division WOR-3 bacterium]
FVASLIGGALAQILNGLRLSLGPFQLTNFHFVFALAGIGRFASLGLLGAVPEERAVPVAEVLVGIGDYAARRLSSGKDLIIEGISFITTRVFANREIPSAPAEPGTLPQRPRPNRTASGTPDSPGE